MSLKWSAGESCWPLGATSHDTLQEPDTGKLCACGVSTLEPGKEKKKNKKPTPSSSSCNVSLASSTDSVSYCVSWQRTRLKDPLPRSQSRPWRVNLELRGNQLITGTCYISTCQEGRKKKGRIEGREGKLGPPRLQTQSEKDRRKIVITTQVGATVTSRLPPSTGPLMLWRSCLHVLSQFSPPCSLDASLHSACP